MIQSETRELASLKRDKIRPNEMDQWHNEQLYVPPLPPTNLRGCHLINIQYDIYVSIYKLLSKVMSASKCLHNIIVKYKKNKIDNHDYLLK